MFFVPFSFRQELGQARRSIQSALPIYSEASDHYLYCSLKVTGCFFLDDGVEPFLTLFQVDLSPGGSSSGNKIGVISSSHRVSNFFSSRFFNWSQLVVNIVCTSWNWLQIQGVVIAGRLSALCRVYAMTWIRAFFERGIHTRKTRGLITSRWFCFKIIRLCSF